MPMGARRYHGGNRCVRFFSRKHYYESLNWSAIFCAMGESLHYSRYFGSDLVGFNYENPMDVLTDEHVPFFPRDRYISSVCWIRDAFRVMLRNVPLSEARIETSKGKRRGSGGHWKTDIIIANNGHCVWSRVRGCKF